MTTNHWIANKIIILWQAYSLKKLYKWKCDYEVYMLR